MQFSDNAPDLADAARPPPGLRIVVLLSAAHHVFRLLTHKAVLSPSDAVACARPPRRRWNSLNGTPILRIRVGVVFAPVEEKVCVCSGCTAHTFTYRAAAPSLLLGVVLVCSASVAEALGTIWVCEDGPR